MFVPNSATLTLTKTRYVRKVWVPDIAKYDVSTGLMRASQDPDNGNVDLVFETSLFGPQRKQRYNFLLALE